ncbi:MAG: xanthine dehydrogenase family protein subunit M [Azospirillaceae bacterium]
MFDFQRAETVDHAIALLGEHGDEARLIAGGQSLMASLNFRLSSPGLLIDITRLDDLKGLTAGADGLSLGALTCHSEILLSQDIARNAPLMTAAAPHIAHEAIRNRGTIGGSIAFADPAAEWPACALALDATIEIAGPAGIRRVPATDFFKGLYETELGPGDLVRAIHVPARPAGERHSFQELTRRHGDYAIVGLAALAVWRDGRLAMPRLAFFGVGAKPVLATAAMAELDGSAGDAAAMGRACEALTAELDPFDDLNASAETRRHLARTLLRRAVARLTWEGADA